MTDWVKFTIPGEPKGKGRPRFRRIGEKGVQTYTDDKTENYENLVKVMYMNTAGRQMLEGALSVTIRAYFPIPKSAPKYKQQQMLEGELRPTVKCDVDNIAKVVLDGLNKVAFSDDKQIVQLIVLKWYSDDPRVVVTIRALKQTKKGSGKNDRRDADHYRWRGPGFAPHRHRHNDGAYPEDDGDDAEW